MTEERPNSSGWLAGVGWRSVATAAGAPAVGIGALVALSAPAPEAAHYAVGDASAAAAVPDIDPLRAELARCRSLPADTSDARCQTAWEVNRRRFMGETRSYVPPVEPPPIEPAPAGAGAAAVAPIESQEH